MLIKFNGIGGRSREKQKSVSCQKGYEPQANSYNTQRNPTRVYSTVQRDGCLCFIYSFLILKLYSYSPPLYRVLNPNTFSGFIKLVLCDKGALIISHAYLLYYMNNMKPDSNFLQCWKISKKLGTPELKFKMLLFLKTGGTFQQVIRNSRNLYLEDLE